MPAERESKTEDPTPRRRRESRESGQVARSQDLAASALLLAGLIGLELLGPRLWAAMLTVMESTLAMDRAERGASLMPQAIRAVSEVGVVLAPILVLMFLAMLAVLYAQVGWLVTLKPLKPNLGKINPIKGVQRLFSGRMAATAAINFLKLLVVALVAYLTLRESAAEIIYALTVGFGEVFSLGTMLAFRLGIRLAAVLVLLALLDYAYQKHRHEVDLRMTKEEVKDEMRSMEGDPTVRRRRREIQMKLSVQRLKKAVPQADVVVTNPTHLAIALRYDQETMVAPEVVAKGADLVAARIRQLAIECGIPIVQRRALARAMYEAVEVGRGVPERFYEAIAEILAYVYELTGKMSASRVEPEAAPAPA